MLYLSCVEISNREERSTDDTEEIGNILEGFLMQVMEYPLLNYPLTCLSFLFLGWGHVESCSTTQGAHRSE